jgi:hypothetical protein
MEVAKGSDFANRLALASVLPGTALTAAGAIVRGIYRLEYTRTKTAFAP